MKKLLSFSLLAASLVFVSCSKEKTSPGNVNPNDPGSLNEKLLVKTSIQNGETVYEYFPDRRIKSISESYGQNPVMYSEFTYAPGSLTITDIVNNKKKDSWTYLLDNNGRNTGCHYRQFNVNGDMINENISTCTYNAAGQMIKEDFGNGYYDEYIYADGNLAVYHSYAGGVFNYEIKYEYYMDKTEKLISCGQFNSKGLGGIRPRFSKNLVKRRVAKNLITQAITWDGVYTYEFDKDGFVTKGKYVNSVAGVTHEWTNTFQ
jgi:hypothetical protein